MQRVRKIFLYLSIIFLGGGCNESPSSSKTVKMNEVVDEKPHVPTLPLEKKIVSENFSLPTKIAKKETIPENASLAPIPSFDPTDSLAPLFEELENLSYSALPYPGSGIPLRGGGGGARCRNGVLERGEECDDGNALVGDGCTISCKNEILFSVSRDDDQLYIIDPKTGNTLCHRTITIENVPDFEIDGANALATDPTTGILWAFLRDGNQRELVTIDAKTGVATSICTPTPSGFAGLLFDKTGALYGVTGDGGSPPETLFTLNKEDATATFFMTLGNGTDGEAIGYNNEDNLLYHASGSSVGTYVFEKIDLLTKTIIPIDNPTVGEEITALTYWAEPATFLAANLDDELLRMSTEGIQTVVGNLDHQSKGLAFTFLADPCP